MSKTVNSVASLIRRIYSQKTINFNIIYNIAEGTPTSSIGQWHVG
jgi:hypothetical protein